MSLSRQNSFDCDFDNDNYYLIEILSFPGDYFESYFYHPSISDEELHSSLNDEFERKINLERYDIRFCQGNLYNNGGADYIVSNQEYDDDAVVICKKAFYPSLFPDFLQIKKKVNIMMKTMKTMMMKIILFLKKYIKKTKSCLASMIYIFKQQTSLDKKI